MTFLFLSVQNADHQYVTACIRFIWVVGIVEISIIVLSVINVREGETDRQTDRQTDRM